MANINKGKLIEIVPSSTIATTASITVNATTQGVEHELIYSASQATASIIKSVSQEIGVSFKGKYKKEVTETIEITKTYLSEAEITCNMKDGFKISFKRSPKKIIKSFLENEE